MKTKLIIIITAALLAQASATTTSFTTTSAEDAQIVEAVGSIMGLGRNATQAEVKAWVISYLTQNVTDYFRRKNITTYVPPPPINPQ